MFPSSVPRKDLDTAAVQQLWACLTPRSGLLTPPFSQKYLGSLGKWPFPGPEQGMDILHHKEGSAQNTNWKDVRTWPGANNKSCCYGLNPQWTLGPWLIAPLSEALGTLGEVDPQWHLTLVSSCFRRDTHSHSQGNPLTGWGAKQALHCPKPWPEQTLQFSQLFCHSREKRAPVEPDLKYKINMCAPVPI